MPMLPLGIWSIGGVAWTRWRDRCSPRLRRLTSFLATMKRPVFPLEGRDVLALGEPEGPRVGALLRAVRQWWLDGGCIAGEEACRAELMRRM